PLKQLRVRRQDQAGQHSAKTVPQRKARHVAENRLASDEGFHRQFGIAIPADKSATMVAVAMALHIAQPQVEMFGQQRQHRLVGAATEPVAMDEVQQRLAAGWAMPASQSETGGRSEEHTSELQS